MVTFCKEVQKAGVSDWKERGAKTLQAAFRKAAAHSHRLLEDGDEDHRRCLEILAFGGVARHFGVLSLGRRLGCIAEVPAETPDERVFRLGLEGRSMVFVANLPRFQELVDKLPVRLSKPKTPSQFFEWIAKLDTDLTSLGSWACHGDTVQRLTRSPSYKKMHTIRKLFSLMVARHPDDFRSLGDARGWSGWELPSDRSSLDLLRSLSPDEKGYLKELPSFAKNWTFLSRVGNPLRATMLTCLVGQALNNTVAAKARDGVQVRDAVLRWRADGSLHGRFERALMDLKTKHKHSHVYHVFKEALRMEGEGR